MVKHEKEVSIVILNFNEKLMTEKCIESILKNDFDKNAMEIVVVDNGSTDGSQAYLKKKFPEMKLIENEVNWGFAKGNNIGIKSSSGKYILIMNNDIILSENTVKILVSCLEENEDVAAVGPAIIGKNEKLKIKQLHTQQGGPAQPMPLWSPYGLKLMYSSYSEKKDAEYINETMYLDVLYGACFMVKREVLNEIGLFDENFFIFLEETDICLRMRKKGYRLMYTPETVVHHNISKTILKKELELFVFFHYEKNKLYFARKHLTPIRFLHFYLSNLIKFPFLLLGYLLFGRQGTKKALIFIKSQLWFLQHLICLKALENKLDG